MRRRMQEEEVVDIVAGAARWTVLILGTLMALSQVNFDVTGFIAGLGIIGFTVGFALQDISRNFIAGVLLLIRQPFKVGDAVRVNDHTGAVLEITARDTVVRTWEGDMVIVPNIEVFTKPIINYSALPVSRRAIRVGVGYGEDSQRVIERFYEILRNTEGILEDPAPLIQAEELGDSALRLGIYFWVDQRTHNMFAIHSQILQTINRVAKEEGIDLPYPTQAVRLEGGLSEVFETAGHTQ